MGKRKLADRLLFLKSVNDYVIRHSDEHLKWKNDHRQWQQIIDMHHGTYATIAWEMLPKECKLKGKERITHDEAKTLGTGIMKRRVWPPAAAFDTAVAKHVFPNAKSASDIGKSFRKNYVNSKNEKIKQLVESIIQGCCNSTEISSFTFDDESDDDNESNGEVNAKAKQKKPSINKKMFEVDLDPKGAAQQSLKKICSIVGYLCKNDKVHGGEIIAEVENIINAYDAFTTTLVKRYQPVKADATADATTNLK
uniref:Uncharacterized protein n=1 Tax=Meloidogyne enterolobii TaxID=390850 RepID=A0A6V7WNE9_MELEN|nr:unnamed protein product [Meloidogyne enterolobii]